VIRLVFISRIQLSPQPRHSQTKALCLEPFQEKPSVLTGPAHLLLLCQKTPYVEMVFQGGQGFGCKGLDIGVFSLLGSR
jgi:hypothetical protein